MSLPPLERDRSPRALAEAWRADVAPAAEVRRAYHRFMVRRRPAAVAGTLRVGRWVLAGVVLGMSSVYAATGALELWSTNAATTEVSAPATMPAPHVTARAASRQREQPEAAPPEAPTLPLNPMPSAPTASSSNPESWQRAARGLRERDFATAEAALEELSRHGSAEERESARLVRAQLLLAQGRDQQAASTLRELASVARSPSVKQKAAALLARMNESVPSERSFEPLEGTKLP